MSAKIIGAGRFDYVAYDQKAQKAQSDLKLRFEALEEHLIEQLGKGRAASLALTKLEECYMWVGKAIKEDQLSRNGEAPIQL